MVKGFLGFYHVTHRRRLRIAFKFRRSVSPSAARVESSRKIVGIVNRVYIYIIYHIFVMELGHLLIRSGLTYPEVSSKVCHDSFCHLENSVSLPWVIYYEAFYLQVSNK